jgi:type IV pilus assembly protein PilC
MPTYKYEALDTSGEEVKDQIDAMNEDEAQQKIKQLGYFVTKITPVGEGKTGKKGKKGGAGQGGPR